MQTTIRYIKESLEKLYDKQEINSFTRIIMENITGLSIPMILIDKNKKLTPDQQVHLDKIIERLKQYEPIQYILGKTEFYGINLHVDENVLIPRPETEELVELILMENKEKPDFSILDIGTGSGAIAIALRKHWKNSKIEAWDISSGALKTASKNAENNNFNISFRQVDILSEYPKENKFDIIASNPPYVLESEKKDMEKNVLEYEPHLALFVPDNKALIFYEKIAYIGTKILNNNGQLYFEINTIKAEEITTMLKEKGYSSIRVFQDLSRKDRMIKAILK